MTCPVNQYQYEMKYRPIKHLHLKAIQLANFATTSATDFAVSEWPSGITKNKIMKKISTEQPTHCQQTRLETGSEKRKGHS